MGKMKRFFSLMLVLTIVLGSFSAVFAAEDVAPASEELKKVPSDVIGTEYEKAVARLVAFNVLDGYKDGTYRPEQDVTRAEFAKILVEALGIGNAARAAQGKVVFPDVPASHWASGYVNVASGQGLLVGFPDGNFRPEDQVTYAEALTMLVRSLGYQDEFLKGVWPGSHIAKAAEAGITSGVNFADARGFANRGKVAQMVNNTLDADVVTVKAYKDGTVEYEESDKTLLKDKLDISKYEDTRVIADKIVDDGLEEDEITVRFLKEIKKDDESVKRSYDEGEEKDFRIKKGVNPRQLIGEEVSVYMDDKDVVVYIESEDDDRAYFDYVEEIKKGKDGEIEEIALVRFDKEYRFDKEAKVYVFDAKDDQFVELDAKDGYIDAKVSDVLGHVGKFVVKNNRIIYAEIMDPAEANPWMLVLKNDKGLLEGINDTTEDFDIDLRKDGDYDGVLVFDTLGNKLDVEDIEEGNIVYVQKLDYDGDDYAYVVVVQDNVVEGELSKVKDDRVTIGDKQIKMVRYKDNGNQFQAYYSLEGFEDIKKWYTDGDWEDDMEDADEEDMVAYLDATGKIAFLSTEALGGGAGYKYGVVTRAYADNDRVKIYTFVGEKDGEEITYKADKDRNLLSPRKLDKYGNALGKDEVHEELGKERKLEGHVVKFKLNKDGEIAEDEFFVMDPENTWVMQERKDFGKDTIPSAFQAKDSNTKKAFYVDDKAVIIDAESLIYENKKYTFDSDDFSISSWKDIAEDNYDDRLEYYVFTKRNNDVDVDALVFIGKDGLSTSSDEEAIYVIDRWSKGGDIYVKYVSFEDGKIEEREVDKLNKDSSDVTLTNIKKEKPYIAKMKSGNKVELFTKAEGDLSFVSGVVSKRDGNIVELKGDDNEYRLSSGVIVYDEDVKKTTSNIRVNDKVIFIVENEINVRVVSIGDQIKDSTGGGTTPEPEKGVVTYINTDNDQMIVDGEIYRANKDTIVKDKDGKVISLGSFKGVKEGDQVEIKDNVVTIKVTATEKEEAALKAAQDAVKALFKDAKKTELAKDVDQAAITAAKKLVDALPADSTEDGAKTPKADLLEDIKKAQGLLDAANTADNIEAADKAIKALEDAITKAKILEDEISEETIADAEKTVKELKGLLADAQAALDKVDMKADGRAKLVTRLLVEEGKIEKFETKIEEAKETLTKAEETFEAVMKKATFKDNTENVSIKYAGEGKFDITIVNGATEIATIKGTGLLAGLPTDINKVENIEVKDENLPKIKAAIIAKFGDAETLADLAGKSIDLKVEVKDTNNAVFETTFTYSFK